MRNRVFKRLIEILKAEKIVITYEKTIQLRQFEPIKCGITLSLPEKATEDNLSKAFALARQTVNNQIKIDIEANKEG